MLGAWQPLQGMLRVRTRMSGQLSATARSPRLGGRGARRLATAALALALAGPFGCNMATAQREDGESDTEDAAEQRTPVLVATVGRGSIESALSAASTIEAERQVTVHAESTGRILSFKIEEGDKIKSGQTLARVKYDDQAAQLSRASTSLENAKRELEIAEKLHRQGIASDDELTAAKLSYKTATLDVRDSKRSVGNTRVTAPFAGTVTERFVTEGAFVSAGAQLISVTDFSTLVALVYVPEKELDRIAVGQAAEIVGKAARSRTGTGVVKRIAPVVDAATGTVKVTVGLPEELVGGSTGFLPGMYTEVRLTTQRHDDVVVVPKRALIRDEEEAFVFVIEEEAAKRVRVELGLQDDERAELLSGVNEGDEIVVSGQAGLKDGGLIQRVDETGAEVSKAGVTAKDSTARAEAAKGAEGA